MSATSRSQSGRRMEMNYEFEKSPNQLIAFHLFICSFDVPNASCQWQHIISASMPPSHANQTENSSNVIAKSLNVVYYVCVSMEPPQCLDCQSSDNSDSKQKQEFSVSLWLFLSWKMISLRFHNNQFQWKCFAKFTEILRFIEPLPHCNHNITLATCFTNN